MQLLFSFATDENSMGSKFMEELHIFSWNANLKRKRERKKTFAQKGKS